MIYISTPHQRRDRVRLWSVSDLIVLDHPDRHLPPSADLSSGRLLTHAAVPNRARIKRNAAFGGQR
jgi:hypothetical protein